jgi:hypothetical protein
MSRKRKSRQKKPRHRPAEVSAAGNLEAMEIRAQAALDSGRHKDAIAAYKALLKEERRELWMAGLARAYAGRAVELANKGMIAEALTIWTQRAATCDTTLATPNYLIWMLQAGRIESVLDHYQALTLQPTTFGPGSSTGVALLREYFAALALSGDARIVNGLADDDPIVRDYAVADTLLTAFCHGNDQGIDAALKGISHRSPYRDFRQIIKAWRQCEQAPADVSDALSRIAEHSPFYPLAVSLHERHFGTASMALMVQVDSDSLALQGALNDWTGKQVELLTSAAALGPAPNAKALFNLLVRFAEVFDQQDARAAALKLLVHYPPGRRGFTKPFGKMSALEESVLEAQVSELAGDAQATDEYWREVLNDLEDLSPSGSKSPSESASAPDSDGIALRKALVLRRLAERMRRFRDDEYSRPFIIDDLRLSLVHDADDAATYVRIIELLRRCSRLKEARDFIDLALERFPQHIGVLLEAVQTALANDAFKKAAGIARQLLKIDPINVKVQTILIDAHLAHARKQIRGRKFALARRELEGASTWARNLETEGKILLLRGILECQAGESVQGPALLQQGADLSGGALVGQYQLLIEGERLDDYSGREWLKLANLPNPDTFATREHVLALVGAVADTREVTADRLQEAMYPLEPALRRAHTEPFTQTEILQVCECLFRAELFDALHSYAELARQRWPNRAVFQFHVLYALSEGAVYELDDADMELLDLAIDAAHDEGDDRTLHRLMEFVHSPGPVGFPQDFPFGLPSGARDGLPTGLPPGFPAEFAQMIEELGPEGMEALLESMESGSNAPLAGSPLELGYPLGGKRKPKRKPSKRHAKDSATDSDQGDLF